MNRKVCIAGWYYYVEFMEQMVPFKEMTFIVAHKYSDWLRYFNHQVIENIGLEFGAYHYYLENIWDGVSHILFMHDDVVMKDSSVITDLFDLCDGLDQAFIFNSEQECTANGAKHGRCFYLSARAARHLLQHEGGIWYDKNNDGHTSGKTPAHCKHYNAGVRRFNRTLRRLRGEGFVVRPVIANSIAFYRRGGLLEGSAGAATFDARD